MPFGQKRRHLFGAFSLEMFCIPALFIPSHFSCIQFVTAFLHETVLLKVMCDPLQAQYSVNKNMAPGAQYMDRHGKVKVTVHPLPFSTNKQVFPCMSS
ncbi:hypothetical protein XELAEV_18014167mg [Xenopus laevis]|uniref:Uncharacterized protein n=1 Tax=Xenopus laevis TaxID=8355 RepID=A0A974HUR0_XENLA|nr:hypothetical protein XELAEV_18014167mg [Xenopus laevis]